MKRKQVVLNERDLLVFRFINKYRVTSAKSTSVVCGFKSLQCVVRRIKKLTDYGYIKSHCLYFGYPHFYSLTTKGLREIGIVGRTYKPSYTTALHYIGVADTAAYLAKQYGLDALKDFYCDKDFYHNEEINERYQLKSSHKPDIIFTKDGETYFVEFERSRKRKQKVLDNILMNQLSGAYQIWVLDAVPFEDIKKKCRESPHYQETVKFIDYEVIVKELRKKGDISIG